MRRRRNETTNDALDLLLDTVCNLFGVVIFVAILAAILVGPPELKEPDSAMAESEVEVVVIYETDPRLLQADRQIASGNLEISRRQDRLAQLRSDHEGLGSLPD